LLRNEVWFLIKQTKLNIFKTKQKEEKMKKITFLVIFSLIVTVAMTLTMNSTPTNVGEATATVNGHLPLYIDPIVPNNTGQVSPAIIYKTGLPNAVSDLNDEDAYPMAIFGINGDNSPVVISYSTIFLRGTGLTFSGKWTWYYIPKAGGSTVSGSLWNNKDQAEVAQSIGTFPTTLIGDAPAVNPIHPTTGLNYENAYGISLKAYVYTITAGTTAVASTENNQVIFTVSAAYNY
jgi:hypothetical protein